MGFAPTGKRRPDGRDDADENHDQEQKPAVVKGFIQHRGAAFDAAFGLAHQIRNRLIEVALDGHVFVDCGVGTRCYESFTCVPREDAVGTGAERQKLLGDRGDVVIGQLGCRLAHAVRRGLEKILDALELRRLP